MDVEMTEEPTGVDTPTTPEGEMPEVSDDGKEPQADTVQAELERTRKALKKANAEAAGSRKQLQAYEDDKREKEEAEMTALEKANAKVTAMETMHAKLQQDIKDTRLNATVTVEAKTLNFINVDEALAHLNRDALEYGVDGKWSGVKDALEAIAKERPHLIKKAVVQQSTDGTKRSTGKATKSQAYDETIAKRYNIRS